MFLRLLVAIALTLPAAADDCMFTAVGFRVMHLGDRVVAVWYPTTRRPADYAYNSKFSGKVAVNAPAGMLCGKRVPLVVFSHGDLGCGFQSIAFTEELARHGYVVAAPDHADAFLCHIEPTPATGKGRPPQPNFLKPDEWNDTTFTDRRDDIKAVIDGLLANPEFQKVIDPERIGAAGHSLGGYTVVGMAGGWPGWTDPRIRAVLALSPYVMPFQVSQTLENIHVPLMYQGGTLDVGITPFLAGKKGAFQATNPPVYFAELKKAGHLAWANCGSARTTASCLADRMEVRLIDEYGIAFLNRYLKKMRQPVLEKRNPALAAYEVRLPNP
jgi:predicted dienelactone hydrolase